MSSKKNHRRKNRDKNEVHHHQIPFNRFHSDRVRENTHEARERAKEEETTALNSCLDELAE